jgi:hypothetical protein
MRFFASWLTIALCGTIIKGPSGPKLLKDVNLIFVDKVFSGVNLHNGVPLLPSDLGDVYAVYAFLFCDQRDQLGG